MNVRYRAELSQAELDELLGFLRGGFGAEIEHVLHAPPSAANKICARLSLRAECLPAERKPCWWLPPGATLIAD